MAGDVSGSCGIDGERIDRKPIYQGAIDDLMCRRELQHIAALKGAVIASRAWIRRIEARRSRREGIGRYLLRAELSQPGNVQVTGAVGGKGGRVVVHRIGLRSEECRPRGNER